MLQLLNRPNISINTDHLSLFYHNISSQEALYESLRQDLIRNVTKVDSIYSSNLTFLIKQKSSNMQSEIADCVINNQKRYLVKITHFFRSNNHVIYEAKVFDSAFFHQYDFYFRFKALKQLHDKMSKQAAVSDLPEYPKTKSFGFFNRTNDNLPLIKQRIRELEYYLTKLLNNGRLSRLPEVRQIHKTFQNSQGRSRSSSCFTQSRKAAAANKECPELYRRQLTYIQLA